jgi:hypothetical protein
MRKVEECLQDFATGLALNQRLPVELLLIFVHGAVTLTTPQLQLPEGGLSASSKPVRSDSLIIAPEAKSAVQPVAMAQLSNSAYATNSHLFVEFGLLVLHQVLEKDLSQDPKIFTSNEAASLWKPNHTRITPPSRSSIRLSVQSSRSYNYRGPGRLMINSGSFYIPEHVTRLKPISSWQFEGAEERT